MRRSFLTIFLALAAGAAVLDRVAVVIGNDVITESEVEQELRLDEFMSSQAPDLSPGQRRACAGRMVDQQLIRHEMEISRYAGPKATEADSMLQTLRGQRFHDNQAEYQAALRKYGITEDEVKQYLLWQLTVLRFTDQRFGSNTQSADGAAPEDPTATQPGQTGPTAGQDSADRLAPQAQQNPVDQQMDAWLQQARSSTRIEFKMEAFQ